MIMIMNGDYITTKKANTMITKTTIERHHESMSNSVSSQSFNDDFSNTILYDTWLYLLSKITSVMQLSTLPTPSSSNSNMNSLPSSHTSSPSRNNVTILLLYYHQSSYIDVDEAL